VKPTPHAPGTKCREKWYKEDAGNFANGHFAVGSLGCHGVGECQFKTRAHAQDFCDMQPHCCAVLQFPFADDCAGGFGCFTPRFGELSRNTLWDRSGGKIWAKVTESCEDAEPTEIDEYAFLGFYPGVEAQSACKGIGELPMPKTDNQQRVLVKALDAMQAAGKLTDEWPKDTIWLGGHYNPDRHAWMWNDGTVMPQSAWRGEKPSAADANQMTEPWLCMTLSGKMQDTDPPYQYGLVCKLSPKEVERRKLAAVQEGAAEVVLPMPKQPDGLSGWDAALRAPIYS